MSELPPPGWPQPPYTTFTGTLEDSLERDGYAVVPNPHPEPGVQRLILQELVKLQACWRLAMRPVTMADRRPGLLVVDRAAWACPEEGVA